MKLAFLFPGQGSQYAGMTRSLCAEYPSADRTLLDENDVLGWDLRKLIFEGDSEQLTRTDRAQPALLAASTAAYRVVREEWGLVPACGAGHSLGELSALCCSGVLSYPDALRLVAMRGELMHEAGGNRPGTMMAVTGLETAAVVEELRRSGVEEVDVACMNAPFETVLSGNEEALGALAERFRPLGGHAVLLSVGAAFHSRYMETAEAVFADALRNVEMHRAEWPVVANRTALPYDGGRESLVSHLSGQLTRPVRWAETMAFLVEQGVEAVVEIGPKAVLKKLARKNAPELKAFAIDVPQDYDTVHGWRRNRRLDGRRFIRACLAAAANTRNGNENSDEYRKGVIEPYRQLELMEREPIPEEAAAAARQLEQALELVRTILATKRVAPEEQEERLGELEAIAGPVMP